MLIIKTTDRDGTRCERLISSESKYLLTVVYNVDRQFVTIVDYDDNTRLTYYMTINQWHKVRDWFELGHHTTIAAYTYPMDQVTIAQAKPKEFDADDDYIFD
jgi:hypothetical protein